MQIEDFFNSHTQGEFQGITLDSVLPQQVQFDNYVPPEFDPFMDETVQEWLKLEVLIPWDLARQEGDGEIPTVVCPLGVEPKKPRALWDGRYVNEFCKDIPFSMDNAAKVAEVAWLNAYLFKLDHKNGYFHVPIHENSRKYFGIFWKGKYYVLTVLPFGWKSSPYIYHSITEAVIMYIRSLGIPMLGWIDDMLGMTEQLHSESSDEEQFQSALRAMVVVSYVMFKAGYFMGLSKCSLIPEQYMTYLGIDCDTKHGRFLVPSDRALKYTLLLREMVSRQWVSYSCMEKMVGKLVSLECAVPPGMWYTREQYSALRLSGVSSTDSKRVRENKYIRVSPSLIEEWSMWVFFLENNSGSPWKKLQNVFVQADVSSDASGRTFAGTVDIPQGPCRVTAGDFDDSLLNQDIQVKEAEALRATLSMIVKEMPDLIKGKTLVCKVDNQVLKAVWERKGTSQNLALNSIGKQIFWMQYLGQFFISLAYVRSEDNKADIYTRQSPGLEASLSKQAFLQIWNKWGPFEWDLMASSSNVQRDPQGRKLSFFSRFYDLSSKGTNLFDQDLNWIKQPYCFPPLPLVGMVLNFLKQNKLDCILILPAINAPWVNLASQFIEDLMVISRPFDNQHFSVLNQSGKRIPKKYPYTMIAAKLSFSKNNSLLRHLFS